MQILLSIEKPRRVALSELSQHDLSLRMTVFMTDCGSLRQLVEVDRGDFGFTHVIGERSGTRPGGLATLLGGRREPSDLSFRGETAAQAVKKALTAGRDVHTFDTGREAAQWWLNTLDAD